MRWRRYRPPMSRGQRARLLCLLAAVCMIVLSVIGLFHLKAILGDLAVTRVTNSVNRLVTEAVNAAIDSGDIQYDELITFQKDANGSITAFQSNMAA